jgi:O-antigen/teichoic acid export membrane protein
VIVSNLVYLLVFGLGTKGYLLAIVTAEIAAVMHKICFGKYVKVLCKYSFNFPLLKKMLVYSLPMVPSNVAWWVMQLSDKYVIINYLGLAASGIYSIAYKIPSILSVITNIFVQAWQVAAIKSSEDSDNEAFVKNVYSYFIVFSIAVSSMLIMLAKPLGHVLYANNYFSAWVYVPILIVAYHFSGLSGVLQSLYSAAKKTGMLFVSTSIGAALNIVLNLICIAMFGVMAAAYTTMFSFVVTWLIRMIHSRRFVKIDLNYIRVGSSFILLICQAIFVSLDYRAMYLVSLAIMAVQVLLFWREIKFIMSVVQSFLLGVLKKGKKQL